MDDVVRRPSGGSKTTTTTGALPVRSNVITKTGQKKSNLTCSHGDESSHEFSPLKKK